MTLRYPSTIRRLLLLCLAVSAVPGLCAAQGLHTSDSVSIRIQATTLPVAIQMLGQYLDRPVLFSGSSSAQVTFETPRPVHRSEVLPLLRGLVEAYGFEFETDSSAGLYRVRARQIGRPSDASSATPVRRGAQAEPRLFVISLRHARAADVAQTINALYGRGSDQGAREGVPLTLADELRSNLVPPVSQTTVPPQAVSTRPATLSGEITVVPESRGNSLLLRANDADYELVQALVQRIDVRPLQVLIEVLIAEVRRDRSLGIGVDARAEGVRIGGNGATGSAALGAPSLGDFVLSVMGVGAIDADVSLALSAQNGEVRILSRPVLLATNNQSASIVVGSQRPFVQVQRALPTDGASRDQVVQYKEVGTKLTVRPSISADGGVQLEVSQEVSSATTETAFNAPVISTRSLQTELLVRDGQSVVLGGLTDRQRDVTKRGLPLLSSLPLIGGLFGSSERRVTETELFVFLTPRVLRTDEDASAVSQPLQDRAARRTP